MAVGSVWADLRVQIVTNNVSRNFVTGLVSDWRVAEK